MSEFKQRCLEMIEDREVMGLNILRTNKDEIIDQFSYGYANEEKKEETTINHIYRIASVSKVFAGLAILKLVEEKKLDIKEDVSKYLGFPFRNPQYPNDIITLEMIMTQTSSLSDGDESNGLGYDGVNGKHFFVDLSRLITDPTYEYYTPKTFSDKKPGTHWEYSNFGCGILACVVEKITGEYFTSYVKRILFDPLNLDASFRIEDIKNKHLVANLYDYTKDGFKLSLSLESLLRGQYPRFELGNNFRGPAGGLLISPKDLSVLMRMLMNKGTYQNIKIFEKESIDFMEEIHWSGVSNESIVYRKKGLQIVLLDGYSKQTLKGHFGTAYGLRSFMLYNDDYGYIFITNGANMINLGGISDFQQKYLKYLTSLE